MNANYHDINEVRNEILAIQLKFNVNLQQCAEILQIPAYQVKRLSQRKAMREITLLKIRKAIKEAKTDFQGHAKAWHGISGEYTSETK